MSTRCTPCHTCHSPETSFELLKSRFPSSPLVSPHLADVHSFANYSFRGCGFETRAICTQAITETASSTDVKLSALFPHSSPPPFCFPPALVGAGTPQLHSPSSPSCQPPCRKGVTAQGYHGSVGKDSGVKRTERYSSLSAGQPSKSQAKEEDW